jgi:hypothetical protein
VKLDSEDKEFQEELEKLRLLFDEASNLQAEDGQGLSIGHFISSSTSCRTH